VLDEAAVACWCVVSGETEGRNERVVNRGELIRVVVQLGQLAGLA